MHVDKSAIADSAYAPAQNYINRKKCGDTNPSFMAEKESAQMDTTSPPSPASHRFFKYTDNNGDVFTVQLGTTEVSEINQFSLDSIDPGTCGESSAIGYARTPSEEADPRTPSEVADEENKEWELRFPAFLDTRDMGICGDWTWSEEAEEESDGSSCLSLLDFFSFP